MELRGMKAYAGADDLGGIVITLKQLFTNEGVLVRMGAYWVQKVGVTPDERVDVKLREIKHVLVQMISLSKLGRLKLGEAQQAYQDVDGDLSKVSCCLAAVCTY